MRCVTQEGDPIPNDSFQAGATKNGELEPCFWRGNDFAYSLAVPLTSVSSREVGRKGTYVVMMNDLVSRDFLTPAGLCPIFIWDDCPSGDLEQPIVKRVSVDVCFARVPEAGGLRDIRDVRDL